MNNIITTKKLIITDYLRKILFLVFASAIFSIPLLLSPLPKTIEAQKAESEIEAEMCISYNKSQKLISITCKYADFADITRAITDQVLNPETLNLNNSNNNNNNSNNERVWLLNAGLKIEEDALLDINSNDVTWLKIIPTEKSPNAISVEGVLKIDSVKITSWNHEENDYVKFPEEAKEDQSLYKSTPRPYIKIETSATRPTEITNSELAYLGYSCNGCGGVTFNGGENSLLKNNQIHHIYKGFYSKGMGHMLIEDNHVYGNDKYGIDPHSGTHDMIIRNNTVYDNFNAGIICSLDCYNILIEKNTVYNNGNGDYKRGIAISKNTYNSTLRENTVYNQDICIHIGRDSHDNKVYDNKLTTCRAGIAIIKDSFDNKIYNNKIETVSNGLVVLADSDDNKFYSNYIQGIQNEEIVIDDDSKGNVFDNKKIQQLNFNLFEEAFGQDKEDEEEQEEEEQQQQPIIKDPNLKTELLVEGLSWPTSMTFIDSNNILVLEKNEGTVRLVSNGSLQEESVLKVDVNNKAERGLLGIAMIEKDTIFLYYTEFSEDDEQELKNKIYKYHWNDKEKLLVNRTLILELPATPGPDHVGGKMTVGPDNYLYIVIGDVKREGKLQNFRDGPDPDDTGVILRVNPEDGSSVPDNPFINRNNILSSLDKYYAYGIRNSFGITFDPITGTLWQTENGPTEYDEVNVVKPGFNSGWNKVMGPISKSDITVEDELVNFPNSKYADPVFSWFPSLGITDIEFLNSSKLGDKYDNNIFVGDIGDLTEGNLYYFELNEDRTGMKFDNISSSSSSSSSSRSSNNNQTILSDLIADNEEELSATVFGTAFGGITDIETGPDGFLYILTLDREADGEGKIYRLTEIR